MLARDVPHRLFSELVLATIRCVRESVSVKHVEFPGVERENHFLQLAFEDRSSLQSEPDPGAIQQGEIPIRTDERLVVSGAANAYGVLSGIKQCEDHRDKVLSFHCIV